MLLRKIISGGQTGADQGALAAARELGLETGGLMPRDFLTEDGPQPEIARLYGLDQSSSASYTTRTRHNIMASDGTLIFGRTGSPGSRQTYKIANQLKMPVVIVPFPMRPCPATFLLETQKLTIRWLQQNEIKVLNVAGNRESVNPGIFLACKTYILQIGLLLSTVSDSHVEP
jgi:hypothetical protein